MNYKTTIMKKAFDFKELTAELAAMRLEEEVLENPDNFPNGLTTEESENSLRYSEEAQDLFNHYLDIYETYLEPMSTTTDAEDFLHYFLQGVNSFNAIYLRPCGGRASIDNRPTNICTVEIGLDTFTFGGISNDFYNKMFNLFQIKQYASH